MYRKLFSLLAFALFVSFSASSQDAKEQDEKENSQKLKSVADAVMPSTVHVEYYLKYDRGEEPVIAGYRCSNCSKFHGTNAGEYVKENRPVEIPGYLISDTEVISPDILTQPRFISKIRVTNGKSESTAKIIEYGVKQQAVILKLEKQLEGSKPAQINPEAKGPYFTVGFSLDNGMWQLNVKGLGGDIVSYPESSEFLRRTMPSSLIVNEKGEIAGVSMNPEMSADDSWKCPVSKMEKISQDQLDAVLAKIRESAIKNIVRVQVNFRSPQIKNDMRNEMSRNYSDDDDEAQPFDTELNAKGIMLDGKLILVLADIKPKMTARLEGIKVFAEGSPAGKPADFVCSMNEFAALVAELKEPVQTKGFEFSNEDILRLRSALLPAVQVRIYGDNLVMNYLYNRITDFDIGWKGRRFPELPGVSDDIFLFDLEGRLIALPLAYRARLAMERYSSYSRNEKQILPVSYLSAALRNLDASRNTANIPLSEKDENRIAWLGLELQQLNPGLARMNKVSELTKNGKNGAVVSYVFPASPAAKAGIREGDILICIYLEDDPAPIEIRAEEQMMRDFPWTEYDRIPDMYFQRIPPPWQPFENSMNSFLTNIGFGKKFTLEYCSGGKLTTKEFTVEKGPDYYDTAEKYKSDFLGLTVKNLTCEVRRYFQKNNDDPGVIVSKIDPGSKASVSGLKPYEIIVQVNGKPVNNVKDFEEQIKDKTDLSFGVSRMAISRSVKIKMTNGKDAKPAESEKAQKQEVSPVKTAPEE
ncbi:MAG: PDZ domain-containing protein [Victivallales bacterium]